jgi:hypothetical protein
MNSFIENKGLTTGDNLPTTGDAPPKVVTGKIAGLGTGVLLAGGAVVGCFALALWNRRALMALVKSRGHRREPGEMNSDEESDAIY